MAQGQISAARDVLLTQIQRFPQDWLSRAQLAELFESSGDLSRALALIAQAIDLQPQQLKLKAKCAVLAQKTGDLSQARGLYEAVMQAQPAEFADLSLNLGNCCFAQGDLAAALAAYQQYLTVKSDHQGCRVNLALVLEKLSRFDEAAAQWQVLAEAEPDNPRWPAQLGGLELKREHIEPAALALERAQQLGAADDSFKINLASLRFEQGNYQDCQAVLVSLSDPSRPELQRLELLSAFQMGQMQDCVTWVQRIQDQGNLESAMVAYSLLPQIYRQLGQEQQAREFQQFDQLVSRQQLGLGERPGQQLEAQILHHPSLQFEPVNTSTHNGSQTQSLLVPGSAEVDALVEQIQRQAISYAARVKRLNSPYGTLIPAQGRIKIWAVALQSDGFQGAHMHPHGVISGVYYLKVPRCATANEGALEFGCPEPKFVLSLPPALQVEPVATDDLVLFPSWYFHRTLPFDAPEPRISIAFDVVPPDSPEWHDPGLSEVFSL